MPEEIMSQTTVIVGDTTYSQSLTEKSPETGDIILHVEPENLAPQVVHLALTMLGMSMPETLQRSFNRELEAAQSSEHGVPTIDLNRLSAETLNLGIAFATYLNALAPKVVAKR